MNKSLKHYLKIFGIAICATLISYSLYFQISQSLKVPSYGAWGIFHYYIGGKYLNEIGYFNIYSCSLEVNKDSWQSIEKVRDLKTYKIVPVTETSECPVNNFSKERWHQFSKDIQLLASKAPTSYWENALTDKGFNATPFWSALSAVFANIVPLNNLTYLLLFNLDILFITITSFIVWRSAGKYAGLITLTLSFLYFGTVNIIGGNFLQYLWLPLLAGSFSLWNKKSYGKSGAVLGLATGLQAFPGFFALPILFVFIVSKIKNRAKDIRSTSTFLKTFITTLIFCFIVGSIYSGVSSWSQWGEKITIQKNYINGEIFNIGFPNLAATVLSNNQANSNTYSEDYVHTIQRVKVIEKNSLFLYLSTLLLLILVLNTLYRLKKINPMIFGYFFIYITTTLSPYYYLTLAILPFAFWDSASRVKRFALWGTVGLFIIHLLLFPIGYIVFDYQKHLLSEIFIFTFLGILLFYIYKERKR